MQESFKSVEVRTQERVVEIAWFDDLCGGDTAYLGTIDPTRRSNFANCSNIIETADRMGFNNILLPTSYVVGKRCFRLRRQWHQK